MGGGRRRNFGLKLNPTLLLTSLGLNHFIRVTCNLNTGGGRWLGTENASKHGWGRAHSLGCEPSVSYIETRA
jgi:hypothetical protein